METTATSEMSLMRDIDVPPDPGRPRRAASETPSQSPLTQL